MSSASIPASVPIRDTEREQVNIRKQAVSVREAQVLYVMCFEEWRVFVCPLDVTILPKGSYQCVIVTVVLYKLKSKLIHFQSQIIGTFVKGLSDDVKKKHGLKN